MNALSLAVSSWTPTRLAREGIYGFCQLIRRDSHLVQGLIDHGMRHDECWQFLRLGRFLERAEKIARLLEIKFHLAPPGDPAIHAAADLSQWRALLRSAGAYEAYLNVGNADLDPQAIVRFLVLDEWFPRSIAYAFAEVETSLVALVRLGTVRADVRALDLAHAGRALVGGRGPLNWDSSLRRLLDQVQERCNAIGSAIALDAFAEAHEDIEGGRHAQASRQTQD